MKFTTGSLCLFASGTYGAAPASFDCEMRKLAVDFASSKIPSSSTKVWEALELGVKCDAPPPAAHSTTLQATDLKLDPSAAIYVDINGDDGNKGTIDAPLQSLQQAVDMSRASGLHTILLNTGTHYIADTITLDSRDSGTTFAASANHSPIISGARPLPNLQWAEHDINNGKNIYVADIPSDLNLASIPGLHYSEGVYGNVGRATKARFPNAEQWKMDEENGGDARISEGVATWMDPIDYSNDPTFTQVFVESPARENTPDGLFQNYVQGVGGPCEIYDPPTSYWCSNATQGGGAFTFRVPSGIYLDPSFLPNLPYASGAPQLEINAWRPARWANWMFEGKYEENDNSVTFTKGGFQGSRGSDEGGDWFISNVFEELDYENEFFFDEAEAKLYFFFNSTGPPTDALNFVAPVHEAIFNISASNENPATDLTFSQLTFTGTRDTYLNAPHGIPSGGDWALERRGAILIEGTENLLIDGCTFTKIDGHGAMISGYNRYATISNSEFSWVGGSAIASWGRTDGETTEEGFYSYNGNYPRFNKISNNIAREIGHFEKQNSFYVQAKTAQSTIENNVFFNGPRAGVNYNDGFGGGDILDGNLIFNTCRESSDHGPFNSWDRQPYFTNVVDESIYSTDMLWREIRNNFFIANYQSQESVDNDDGSAYFETHHNFLAYSGNGLKNDYGGHDNVHHDNIYAYTGKCMGDGATQLVGHLDFFHDNHCVLDGSSQYADFEGATGPTDVWPVMFNNSVFSPDGTTTVNGIDLVEFQKSGHDLGTTVSTIPSDDVIIGWARDLFGL